MGTYNTLNFSAMSAIRAVDGLSDHITMAFSFDGYTIAFFYVNLSTSPTNVISHDRLSYGLIDA